MNTVMPAMRATIRIMDTGTDILTMASDSAGVGVTHIAAITAIAAATTAIGAVMVTAVMAVV